MDNKYEFMSEVVDAFAGLKTDEEIEFRGDEMIRTIEEQKMLAKAYLKAGIL